MKIRYKLLASAALASTALLGTQVAADGHSKSIATVVKIAGIQWFNRMEEGVNKFAEETGMNAFQVGPAQADPQQQVALIEDMIARLEKEAAEEATRLAAEKLALEEAQKKAAEEAAVPPKQGGSQGTLVTLVISISTKLQKMQKHY